MVGVLLTPLGMLYGDIGQALPVLTTFLMLLTPVVYPTPSTGIAHEIAMYNPMAPLIITTRDWLTVGGWSGGGSIAMIIGAEVACLVLGWVSLRVAMPHLVARAGS